MACQVLDGYLNDGRSLKVAMRGSIKEGYEGLRPLIRSPHETLRILDIFVHT